MPIRVDGRLSKIAALVEGETVADIGCDHGKLGYYLLGHERAKHIIATDISAKSLEKARILAAENGVSDALETRIGNGLQPLKSEEADTVVIAGLGGDVISEILQTARREGKKFRCFVLAPNTHAEKVRMELVAYGHQILHDEYIFVGDKTYVILKSVLVNNHDTASNQDVTRSFELSNSADDLEVINTCESLDNTQLRYGKFYKTSDSFKKFAAAEITKSEAILKRNADAKNLKDYVAELKAALMYDNQRA